MGSDDLVRKITAEVIRRLGESSVKGSADLASPAGGGHTAPSAKHALVLLTGSNQRLDDMCVQLGKIAQSCETTTIVLSPSAQKMVGLPAIRRSAPEARVLVDGDIWELLEGQDIIYMPCMSLNAAAKIGNMMADSLVCILATYGLLCGIPIVATGHGFYPAEIDYSRTPQAVKDKLSGMKKKLEALGITFVRLCHLASADSAVAAALSTSADSSCALATSGECDTCGGCVVKQPKVVESLVSKGADRIGASVGALPRSLEIARMIDHTLLKPDATEEKIRKLCDEAKQYNFASVCVNPSWVSLCAELLRGSEVMVCTVIGFPLGATTPTTKGIETRDAIANGANEIDMVINVGALKSGDDALVRRDIEAVVVAARGQARVKVILETALLSKEEIIKASLLAKMAGADFVKTSTGFGGGGATVEDIALMRETVGPEMGVKASGGINDRDTAEAMVAAGATRIGASASVAITTGQKSTVKGY